MSHYQTVLCFNYAWVRDVGASNPAVPTIFSLGKSRFAPVLMRQKS